MEEFDCADIEYSICPMRNLCGGCTYSKPLKMIEYVGEFCRINNSFVSYEESNNYNKIKLTQSINREKIVNTNRKRNI